MNNVNYPPRSEKLGSGAVDALRFIFMCVICLWHCHPLSPWLHNGYIAVEFYFMVSGFLIYRSFLRHPDVGVLDFTLKKVKRFALPFWVSILLLMALDRKQYIYLSSFTPDGILETWFSHLHEFFFCQCMGLTDIIAINHPLWFLSVLIFGGAVLYSILRNCRTSATSLVIPSICIIGFPIYLNYGKPQYETVFHPWMVRGVAEMALGIMTAVFLNRKRDIICQRELCVNIVSTMALAVFLLMMVAEKEFTHLQPFIIPLILIGAFTSSSWMNILFRSKIWHRLSDLSMYMYFIHLLIASIYYILCGTSLFEGINVNIMTAAFLLIVMCSAWGLRILSDYVMRRLHI